MLRPIAPKFELLYELQDSCSPTYLHVPRVAGGPLPFLAKGQTHSSLCISQWDGGVHGVPAARLTAEVPLGGCLYSAAVLPTEAGGWGLGEGAARCHEQQQWKLPEPVWRQPGEPGAAALSPPTVCPTLVAQPEPRRLLGSSPCLSVMALQCSGVLQHLHNRKKIEISLTFMWNSEDHQHLSVCPVVRMHSI